ncbi:CPBP family intramembrane metalloprotease [Clostridium botulinum]|uniref:CPBP family intramembrane glutamic endopeptidase n=1 Tax=Clostridium botulinum TaxID=1491 RepID=UPI00052C8944|nr:type II CAAX endopeptidase family protein [Clostridium botulinum]KGM97980.1 CAAX protease [Clostridium botulinum D str. CCUG 7971]KOC46155.1 CAAX protease [Clostridium botulinum]NFO99151.1 CPBP family intramembrane metalloprotease [Clostridium botulinum]OOV50905.1 CPBP family intramembrane metalloprotease domain-containing protein [Clostridium botulinum D/C]OOV53472.1 CPBP family intramembrane metalloprotease domain-containing protein [Clostridium botulinum D/C]
MIKKHNKLSAVIKIFLAFLMYCVTATVCTQVLVEFLGNHLFNISSGKEVYFKVMELLLNTEIGTLLLKTIESICVFSTIFLLLKAFDNKSIRDIGLRDLKKNYKYIIYGLILGAVSITAIFLISLMGKFIVLDNSLKKPSINKYIIIDILLFILVGINEEVLCRGYILNVLDIKKKPIRSSIISSVIFSLLHILNPNVKIIGMINIFLIGLLFSYMYINSKNLWMSIGYHITWNYFQGNVFGFPVSGQNQFSSIYSIKYIKESIITGGEFGPEAGILVTLIICISFIFVYNFISHNKVYANNSRQNIRM